MRYEAHEYGADGYCWTGSTLSVSCAHVAILCSCRSVLRMENGHSKVHNFPWAFAYVKHALGGGHELASCP